ncbi:antiviral reverse transcriptase Drt2 [Haliscomenobacter sp.]|uniref:antiviral reverse transcriptase Drt2 n=1 Tax=Haliscomenobacter sp. TaxID=2717303 RepID=UPI003593A53D
MKDWLKLKKYTHFSPPLVPKNIPFIRSYVSNPAKIIRHRFYPFIHYTICENRFRRPKDKSGRRAELRTEKKKTRQIFYANHLDAQIFAYYGHLITTKLDDIYRANPVLNNSVIAYRRIEFNQFRNKCNIDFAKEVFDFISNADGLEICALCFDVKSFFDTLDHITLKKAWSQLFDRINLEEDHYKVYRAITRYTYVEIGDLIKEFKEFKVKKLKYLKNKEIQSFCKSGAEFRDRVEKKGLIIFNKYDALNQCPRTYGIPQGSPISAVLSNLYMLEFDLELTEMAERLGGLYRRYSDDILFICPPEAAAHIKTFVADFIQQKLKLTIQKDKTQEVIFSRSDPTHPWSCYTIENGQQLPNCPLSYLGFDFDGQKILLRQKSLSLFYRNMKRLIKRKARYAYYAKQHNQRKNAKLKDSWIFKRRIYKSKSHLGSKKKTINGKVFWGNYISYAYTASRAMDSPQIRDQVRNHWRILERKIGKYEAVWRLAKTPPRKRKSSTVLLLTT